MSGRFGNRWRYRSRVRYARGRYSGRRVGSARRARGNARAANQQNDISNVTINLMKKIKTGVTGYFQRPAAKATPNVVEIGTCALNIFELLRKSDFYSSYANMYDQFRINRIQVKLTPITWQTYNQFNLPSTVASESLNNPANPVFPDKDVSVYTTDTDHEELVPQPIGAKYAAPRLYNVVGKEKYVVPQALTIVTAWDRTGLDDTQMDNINIGNVDYKVISIGDRITSYSSAKSNQLVAGANFNCVRYLYPSSQQEKSLYFSTTELVEQIADPTSDQPWYALKEVAGADSTKITNLHSDPNCPFKPTFLVGVLKVDELGQGASIADDDTSKTSPEITTGQIYPVTFNLEFDIGVTFRGLRKTQVV